MRFSAWFIQRPVATTLLTLAVLLAGVLGFRLLPVAPLPQVDLPVIIVTASLPGASPEIMASSVATPLERALGRIAGVSEMTSRSSSGSTVIIMMFDLERDINGAARDVQAAINAAQSLLPAGMPGRPNYRKVNPSSAPVMILALTSDLYSPGQLYDLASTRLTPRLAQIVGVGDVVMAGSSLPAVRVALHPQALFHQGVSLDAVRNTLTQASQHRPLGALEDRRQRWQLHTRDQLNSAADFASLIVHHHQGAAVRLADVATVSDAVQDRRVLGMADGKPAVLLIVRKTPEANVVATIDRIRGELPGLQQMLPASVSLIMAQERSATIRASLHEVEQSLIVAAVLVVLVVFLFLRSGRATLIPAVAIPVSLIGTFAAMYLCGFSLNNLSLMALTIATGFVVDDAIVMLENIARHVEEGLRPLQAARKGVSEVGFTVLSMSLSLVVVFAPLILYGGLVGRFLFEFAVTLSVAILISLLVSLTLTPMMCAVLLKPRGASAIAGIAPQRLLRGYGRSLNWMLDHSRWALLLLATAIALSVGLFIQLPKTLLPEQDTGRLAGFISADQSISFQAMRQKIENVMLKVKADPAVASVVGFTGDTSSNSGSMFIALRPLAERSESAQQVVDRLRQKLAHEPGARLFFYAVQDFRTGGRGSNASYQYSLLSDDMAALREWEPRIRRAFAALPQLTDVNSSKQDKGSELALIYDRDSMARLGITMVQADALLNNAFGQRQIATLYQPMNQYKVVMEVDPREAQDARALEQMFAINGEGKAIPLARFAHWQPASAPLSIEHEGLSAATMLSFNLPAGVSLSEASRAIERSMVALGVPASVRGSFAGTAQIFQQSQDSQLWLIVAAIAVVYIVLGILYESYIHPLTILSTLPSAGAGALLALALSDTPFSLIALIGILLLIGIVKKNAIMMVDFALRAQRNHGLSARDAIWQASLLRFRPIVMTTLAALLGALPLMLTSGDGVELRQPLGIAIAGGLILSQLLTLYTTPAIYLYMDKLSRRNCSRGEKQAHGK